MAQDVGIQAMKRNRTMNVTTTASRAGVPPARRRTRQTDVAVRRPGEAGRRPCFPTALLAAAFLAFFTPGQEAWTQYPPPYPYPPPTTLIGPTAGASLRNAAAATLTQADIVRKGANAWGRRANAVGYRIEQFQLDFGNQLSQFQMLRIQFESVAALVAQLGRPRANNAVFELDAGLNIIGELFPFLESQFNAGTLDRNTVVRTCRSFEDAIREWEREFRRNDSRMGFVW